MVLSASTILQAQQSSYPHKWKANNILGDKPERIHHFYDELNCYNNPPAFQPLYKDKIKTLNAFIPDFQVNENSGPNGADQSSPSISADITGNFVITWMDERNGDEEIYAQRYSSESSVLGTNFKVNDGQGGTWESSPSISTDGSANFVITWTDRRNGESDIYAQRY